MRGIAAPSLVRLSPHTTQKRISDSYQLLITKKPVAYDYVAVDLTSLVAVALRLSKNVTTEQRRNKEVSRNVLNGLQQLLRKIVCRQSLLIVMDGAETVAKAHICRTMGYSRRQESRLQRLPATSLMRAVEERMIRSMPLSRGLIPGEVVFSGPNVHGCVEGKMTSWALDLACRDGLQQHTNSSLCLIGSSELWLSVLGLTPFYQATSIVQHNADLRQLRLSDSLAWLGMDSFAREGKSGAVAHGRTDVLLLYLLSHGSGTTELSALPGSNFTVLIDAYRQSVQATLGERSAEQRDWSAGSAESVAASTTQLSSSSRVSGAEVLLFRDLPGGRLELDLEALLRLFLPSNEVRSRMQSSGGIEDSESVLSPKRGPMHIDMTMESYLSHLLDTHALFCTGKVPNSLTVPAYLSIHKATVSHGTATPVAGVSISSWLAYLKMCIAHGTRYRAAGDAPLGTQWTSVAVNSAGDLAGAAAATEAQNSMAALPLAKETSDPGEARITDAAPALPAVDGYLSTSPYYPFWTPTQPLTAAEYSALCIQQPGVLELVLNELGVFGAAGPPTPRLSGSEICKKIIAADTMGARRILQSLFSNCNAERPHPSLCFAPSYCWLQNAKTKQWGMRYVDLGVVAAAMDIRHARSTLSGMNMELSHREEGAVRFDVQSNAWVPQMLYPIHEAESTASSVPPPAPGTSRHLKVLTWNVMFDRYSGQPTPLGMPGIDWCSPQRYPVLSRIIEEEDADVVGMQEVEHAFAKYLAAQPWCQERYIMSCSAQSSVLDPWGVLLLVRRRRWPIQHLTHVNIPAWSNHVSLMPVVSLSLSPSTTVNIASMHLLAPYLKSHEVARTAQDQVLRQCITRQLHGETVVMGDFNDWPTNEFVMPSDTKYVECWPLLHPGNAGKTMDETNTFCKLKIEELFFGRSDKVFLRSPGKRLTPVEAHLVGTKSINEENQNSHAPAYLFPSDHYGVSLTFQVK